MSIVAERNGPIGQVNAEFRASARVVIEESCAENGWTQELDPKDLEHQRRFHESLDRRGWATLAWDCAYGGAGLTLRHQAAFAEECVRHGTPAQFNRVALGIVGPALIHFGSQEQRSRYLPCIRSGAEVWCQGFSEPNAGSDLAALRTTAEASGDAWVITGQKVWTTLAADADFCFLLARTGSDRHRGITAFVVPMHQPGITVQPIRQINGEREFSEVFFDGALASDGDVIGSVGAGWSVAMGALSYERSVHLIERQVRLEAMAERAACLLRRLPPGAGPESRLLELQSSAIAMKYACDSQLADIDAGLHPSTDANATKVLWSETYQGLAALGVDMAASIPGTPDLDYWLYEYYSSLATTIFAGTSQIQRNIIAERTLGLPR